MKLKILLLLFIISISEIGFSQEDFLEIDEHIYVSTINGDKTKIAVATKKEIHIISTSDLQILQEINFLKKEKNVEIYDIKFQNEGKELLISTFFKKSKSPSRSAYEISNLNFSNTDLVVLSACETGLGDIYGSEGVYGLQRAFKMAGVENLIMSLWEVPDLETAEFMESFYSKWIGGIAARKAFQETQREMSSKYAENPEKWAAFIMVQ